MEFGKRYTLLRVYFNRRSDWPLVWSVDDGDQKNEIHVSSVLMEGVSITEAVDLAANPDSPVAWIQFHGAILREFDNGVLISNNSNY